MTTRPTWAEIDLDAVRHNCAALRAQLAPGVRHLAVVKANAYGHGDLPVARACLEAGVDWLGVALVEEGARLRAAGIDAPILVLFEAPPQAAKEVVAQRLTAAVYTRAYAEALSEAGGAANARHPVHLCLDTGMHREGVLASEALELARHMAKLPGIEIEGLWTHLAFADEREHPVTDRQLELFADLCERLARDGIRPSMRHVGSTPALVRPALAVDMVRTGITIYGLYPGPALREVAELRPAMRLVSRVSNVKRIPAGEGISYGLTWAPERDSNIATVPIGYADGYSRRLSNRGQVLIHGLRRRIAGRVTMDQIMMDCGQDNVAPGDEVVLIGRQSSPPASDEITADEVAAWIGTINYEVVCGIGPRVPRVYLG